MSKAELKKTVSKGYLHIENYQFFWLKILSMLSLRSVLNKVIIIHIKHGLKREVFSWIERID